MTTDPSAAERVYAAIKDAILEGQLRLRQRLDIDALARTHRVSATPVRQALAYLTAEKLVTWAAPRGYHVTFWSEAELSALYEWRASLALMAAASYAPSPPPTPPRHSYPLAVTFLFCHLAANANAELRAAGAAADARLRAAYAVEGDVLGDTDGELRALAAAAQENIEGLRPRLRGFFRRRVPRAGLIRARAGVCSLGE